MLAKLAVDSHGKRMAAERVVLCQEMKSRPPDPSQADTGSPASSWAIQQWRKPQLETRGAIGGIHLGTRSSYEQVQEHEGEWSPPRRVRAEAGVDGHWDGAHRTQYGTHGRYNIEGHDGRYVQRSRDDEPDRERRQGPDSSIDGLRRTQDWRHRIDGWDGSYARRSRKDRLEGFCDSGHGHKRSYEHDGSMIKARHTRTVEHGVVRDQGTLARRSHDGSQAHHSHDSSLERKGQHNHKHGCELNHCLPDGVHGRHTAKQNSSHIAIRFPERRHGSDVCRGNVRVCAAEQAHTGDGHTCTLAASILKPSTYRI
jgi:hypothetical protein